MGKFSETNDEKIASGEDSNCLQDWTSATPDTHRIHKGGDSLSFAFAESLRLLGIRRGGYFL